jgi:hypothetical protein
MLAELELESLQSRRNSQRIILFCKRWLRGRSQLSSQNIIWPKADKWELSNLNDLTTTSIRTS